MTFSLGAHFFRTTSMCAVFCHTFGIALKDVRSARTGGDALTGFSWVQPARRGVASRLGKAAIVVLAFGVLLGCVDASSVENATAPAAEQPSQTQAPNPAAELDATTQTPQPTAEQVSPAPSVTDTSTALGLLETLPVKGRAPKTGYDRAGQFGTPWLDVDRNGCDTRNDILQRDLTAVVLSGPCKVLSGILADPMSGQTVQFLRGNTTSTLVQIDHLVALSDAWQKGAQQLSHQTRVNFANDPLNLMAVNGSTNSSKGDGDAATWLPPNRGFWCEYVARQISVKAHYLLWVTQAEKDAMVRVLGSCPGQVAYQSSMPAAVAGVAAGSDAGSAGPAGTAADVTYQNCSAARVAGAAPVRVGDPGYGRHLDRDGDGVGCE